MRSILLIFLAVFVFVGCRSTQLKRDQHDMRRAIIDLQTDQIMDNLIRAHRRLPFVHIDYRKSVGTVTQEGGAGLSTTQVANRFLVGAPNTVLTEPFNLSTAAENVAQLTIEASPVYDQNSIYRAYLEFIKPDPIYGERLIESCNPPGEGEAHICREFCDRFYWVPIQFRDQFLGLAMKTTVLRGDAVKVPDSFEVTIVEVSAASPRSADFTIESDDASIERPEFEPEDSESETDGDQRSADFVIGDESDGEGSSADESDSTTSKTKPAIVILKFNKEIPNDQGTIFIPVGELTFRYRIENRELSGDNTKQLRIDLTQNREGPKTADEARMLFFSKTAKLKLDSYRPDPKPITDSLDDLSTSIELLRLNEIRN